MKRKQRKAKPDRRRASQRVAKPRKRASRALDPEVKRLRRVARCPGCGCDPVRGNPWDRSFRPVVNHLIQEQSRPGRYCQHAWHLAWVAGA